jgi:DNA-binding sugar fermentation-stimulating protein
VEKEENCPGGETHKVPVDLGEKGLKGAVIFIVHGNHLEYFSPDYHTDLSFAQTLCSVKDRLFVRAPWYLLEKRINSHGNHFGFNYSVENNRT